MGPPFRRLCLDLHGKDYVVITCVCICAPFANPFCFSCPASKKPILCIDLACSHIPIGNDDKDDGYLLYTVRILRGAGDKFVKSFTQKCREAR